MIEDELRASADAWRALIERVEIGGALPVRLEYESPRVRYSDCGSLRLCMQVPAVNTQRTIEIVGSRTLPWFHKTEEDRLKYLRRMVMSMYEHELLEQFRLDGQQVFAADLARDHGEAAT